MQFKDNVLYLQNVQLQKTNTMKTTIISALPMDDCVSPSENNSDTQVDMSAKRTYEQVVDWLKAAQKRQQEWQQEVKQRWAAKQQSATIVKEYETALA